MTAEKHKGRLQSKGQKSGVNKEGGYTSGEKNQQRIKNSGTVFPFNATKNLNTAASTSILFCSPELVF